MGALRTLGLPLSIYPFGPWSNCAVPLESEIVGWLRENLAISPRLKIGVGDDAALLTGFEGGEVVLTTDTVTDQVDFILSDIDPRQAGHKAMGVNLSDLAAMAASPVAALVSLVLPMHNAYHLALEIFRGMLPLAERYDTVIAGGDINTWDGPLAISITAIGEPTKHGMLTRSGAQPDDVLMVTGELGGSILGRHLDVHPRVEEALLLKERYELNAGLDISDGLSLDASRLAAESNVGILLDLDAIPVAQAARELSKQDGRPPVEHALADGEDFELLLAVSLEDANRIEADRPLPIPVTRIGQVISEPGMWQLSADSEKLPLEVEGFRHEGDQ